MVGESIRILRKIDETQAYTWAAIIEDRKLVEFQVRIPSSKFSYSDVESELVEKYGKSVVSDTQQYQNGFGARFEGGSAMWKFPDGSLIVTNEIVFSFSDRLTTVIYRTKDRAAAAAAQHAKEKMQATKALD